MHIPRNVDAAIKEFIAENQRNNTLEETHTLLISAHYGLDWKEYEDGQFEALNLIDTATLMQCLVNGYQVDPTPEEKLLRKFISHTDNVNFYKHKSLDKSEAIQEAFSRGFAKGVQDALTTFGKEDILPKQLNARINTQHKGESI